MLKELIINENQSLSLNEELYSELHKAKLSDQTLPYKIQNNSKYQLKSKHVFITKTL